MKFIEVGELFINLDRVVALAKGRWSNTAQDWTAVAVMDTGTHIETGVFLQEFLALAKPQNIGAPSPAVHDKENR